MKKKKWLIVVSILISSISIASFAQTTDNTQQLLEQVKALQKGNGNTNQENSRNQNNFLPNMPTQKNASNAATVSNNNSSNAYQTTTNLPTNLPPKPYMPPFKAPFSIAAIPDSSTEQIVSQNAFSSATQSLLPMSPEQIHRLRQLYSASQYAAAAPAGTPARPTATSLFVDLSPGASPPAVNLAEGDITALVFLDSTGAPWPIEAIDNGNPNAFDIQWNKKDNVLLVQASSAFGRGNLAVRLRQLGPPVMVSLFTNSTVQGTGGVVDYRVDLRIPGFGPNATPIIGNGTPNSADPILLDVLDGIPPDGSKALDLSDNTGQGWLKGDSLFIRTRLTLLSPAWIATMSSADGTNAYQLQQTPLLLMSQNGKVIQVKIKGF